ncbi:MAG TPA: hypothetical protein VFD27_11250 [Chthoniobacteraceae bacterium]|nr:hypothetical protein [Chthoniobacteraceae bacterium]
MADVTKDGANVLSARKNAARTIAKIEAGRAALDKQPPKPATESRLPKFLDVADAQKAAVIRHPDLGVAGSPLHQRFMALYRERTAQDPDFVKDIAWPWKLAEEASQAMAGK